MNALQEATLNMQRAVEQHLDANIPIIETVRAFSTAFDRFKGFNTQIIPAVGAQETPRTGFATDKRTSKTQLCNATLIISKPMRAFATDTGDNALFDEVDYAFTELNRLRDDQIAPRCQIIHDRALANLPALGDYGITAEKLAVLQNEITGYTAQVPKPRSARADRSVQTANLAELFRESKKALKQMDDLIDNFATDHADFVRIYKDLRKVDKPSSTTTQLKGKVTNKSDGTAIKDATITIVEATKTANSNSLGNYSIKPAPIGKFTIRVTKAGFTDFEAFDFDIKLGDITTLNVELMSS